MKRLLYSLAALFVLVVAALAWLVVAYPARTPAHGQLRTVSVELPPNGTLDMLASQLHRNALIDEPQIFALYARVMGAQDRLRSGHVLVTTQMTIRQLLQRTATGYGPTPIRITIPEGFSRFDVAARLAEWNICSPAEFLQATGPQTATGEGYLFPDTYWLNDEQPASQVVRKLADNSQRRMQRLFADEASALATLERDLDFGPREIVIMASIGLMGPHAALAQAPTKPERPGMPLTALDYIEIEQLNRQYAWALDTCTNDGFDYADLYAPDGVFISGDNGQRWEGRERLAEAAGGNGRGCPFTRMPLSHVIVNLVIEPTPEGARGKSYLVYPGIDGQFVDADHTGHDGGYQDAYVKTPDGWRFKTRRFVASEGTPGALLPQATGTR